MRTLSADSDGVLQVLDQGDDWVEITIWNPDGSQAEMSGNGTRIAARWHGGDVVAVRVGPREVIAELREDGLVEQDLGEVTVSEPEDVEGIRLIAVDVGNPHAVGPDSRVRVAGATDRARLERRLEVGPLDEQVAVTERVPFRESHPPPRPRAGRRGG